MHACFERLLYYHTENNDYFSKEQVYKSFINLNMCFVDSRLNS